jgi:hypothetical protein
MLARVKPFAKVARVLHYNEEKVKKGQAECIYAGNYLKEAGELTRKEKRERFNAALEGNQRVVNTAMHIKLQFAPEEKPDNELMIAVADFYMRHIGYGGQPYLLYRHLDTAFAHLHIATIAIRPDGQYIRTPFMARKYSEPARKAAEMEFGLIKAQGRKRVLGAAPERGRKIVYGQMPTEEAIGENLRYILHHYRYRSVAELNAILGLYNIVAKTGRPGSRLWNFGGLLFQVLDENGVGRGVPVKASSLPGKPTLKWLQPQFEKNRLAPMDAVGVTRLLFEAALRSKPADGAAFQEALRGHKIAVAPDVQPDGTRIGMLLVNLRERTVVNANELGKGYDWGSLRKRLGFDPIDISRREKGKKPVIKQKQQQRIG